jgi:hypothetical protein
MYERMLNKQITPTENEIKEFIGIKSVENMEILMNCLNKIFEINVELKFPLFFVLSPRSLFPLKFAILGVGI